jgi:hypothetical protein
MDPQTWPLPDPLKISLRNPLVIPEPKIPQNDATPTETAIELKVQGIVYSDITPSAIVNEQVVKVGHSIHGATIVAISPSLVEFEKDGRRWTQSVR